MAGQVLSTKSYLLTFAALLALTFTTVMVGYIDLGWGSMFMAVLIATMKAILIASFFMHALLEAKLVKLVIAGALLWFLIMVTLTLGDYVTRAWMPYPGK
ncbi:MAG TPA: cytochrome C oxidase subunit IV family protein [Candidatus Acidoferrales bacterium]|nr:cytochrome C oxidase subunit IV family protein [Candidatus Acidoferrales bacterium]